MTPFHRLISFFILSCSSTLVYSYSFLPKSSNCNVIEQQVYHNSAHLSTISNSPSLDLSNGRQQQKELLSMRVSRGHNRVAKGDTIGYLNQQRKHYAGKPGTKHYLDPKKIFIGNIPYDATVEDLSVFFREHLGHLDNVVKMKIIIDYKTGKSKGYGFIMFSSGIYATSALLLVKGKKLNGRVVRLDQGRKKDDLEGRELFVKNRTRNKSVLDDESTVIDDALDEVEGIATQSVEDENVYTLNDFDEEDDTLFGEQDDDDDEGDIDGVFEEIYKPSKWEQLDDEITKNMNREQRREAQNKMPRKKLPHKGFE